MAVINTPSVSQYPLSTCIFLTVPMRAQVNCRDVRDKCKRAWAAAHPGRSDSDFEPQEKGFHLSLITFFSKNREQVDRIMDAAKGVARQYSEFEVGPHPSKGVTILDDGTPAAKASKDFVACQMMVVKSLENKEHKILVALNKQIAAVVKEGGGVVSRTDFIPHITLGRLTPPGVNGFAPPDVGKWSFLVSSKNLAANTRPREALVAPAAPAAPVAPAAQPQKRAAPAALPPPPAAKRKKSDESLLDDLIAMRIMMSEGGEWSPADVAEVERQIRELTK